MASGVGGTQTTGLPSAWERLAAIAEAESPDADFYPTFLELAVEHTGTVGAIIWSKGTTGKIGPRWIEKLNHNLLIEHGLFNEGHLASVQECWTSGRPAVRPPAASEDYNEEPNPTPFIIILAPIVGQPGETDGECEAVMEVFIAPDMPATARTAAIGETLKVTALAQNRAVRRRFRMLMRHSERKNQLRRLADRLHSSLDIDQVGYDLVNELRQLFGCDRVSLAVGRGPKLRMHAVSGQDSIDRRGNVVRHLTQLMTAVAGEGQDLWCPTGETDTAPTSVQAPLRRYVDETFSKSLAILPLQKARPEIDEDQAARPLPLIDPHAHSLVDDTIGVVCLEYLERESELIEEREIWSDLRNECGLAVANALHHSRLFLMPVWRAIGRLLGFFRGKTRNLAVTITAVATIAILAAIIVPDDLTVHGRGALLPVERRNVFSETDGIVDEIKVRTGEEVTQGQVLLRLISPELDTQINESRGRLEEAERQLTQLMRRRHGDNPRQEQPRGQLATEQRVIEARIATLKSELEILADREDQLVVRSPIDGIVTTWNIEERLAHRPVAQGQQLLTVAHPDSEWEIELDLPTSRLLRLEEAAEREGTEEGLVVSYVLESHPNDVRYGRLVDMQPAATDDPKAGNVVKLRVDIELDAQERRQIGTLAGTEVIAHVHCDRSSWLHCRVDSAVQWWQRFRFTWLW